MDDLFQVSVRDEGDWTVVVVSGEIDVSTAPTLRAHLDALPSGAQVIVDLSEVTFLDSTGLGVLVAARRRARATAPLGEVHLVVTRPRVAKVLEVTGLSTVFAVHPSLSEALGR